MLDFLKNIRVENAEGRARRVGGGGGKNPTGLAIRVTHTGAIYPSPDLVAKFNLEYTDKGSEEKGNGMDVINSKQWAQIKDLPAPMLFIAAVPRSEGKCTLFQQVGFTEDGKPVTSVLTQASTTAGNNLKAMVKDVYGIDLDKDRTYVDLVVVDEPLPSSESGIYNIPKTVARGPKKDETTYVRREKLVIYPFVPAEMLTATETENETQEEQALVSHD
jgi:hypothetical protein